MFIALLAVVGILIVALIILTVLVVRKSSMLNTALAALITSLTSLGAALAAPSFELSGDLDVHFGSWAKLTGHWAKVNTTRPDEFWYVAFGTLGFLTFVTLCLVYKDRSRERKP